MATAQTTTKPAPNTPAAKPKAPRAPPTFKGASVRVLRSLDRAAKGAETIQRSSKLVGTHAQTDAHQKAVKARVERILKALEPWTKSTARGSDIASEIPDA